MMNRNPNEKQSKNYVLIHLIQTNFNGSNTFGTKKICLKQGKIELMRVIHSARTGDIVGIIFSSFSDMYVCCVFSLESPH